MVGHFPGGSMGLLRLPDEILLRLLRALVPEDGTYKSDNLRDVWNVATTCRTLYFLALKMMHSMTLTHLELVEEGVPRNVVTAMPDDVVQGALLALRSSYEYAGPLCQAIRVVRLGAMARAQLQVALKRLRRCSALTELCFVDAEGGVKPPEEVAYQVRVLSITSPHWYTIRALRGAQYVPERLTICCVDDDAVFEVANAWEVLARSSIDIDVTWTCGLVPGHKCDGMFHLPISYRQLQGMQIDSRRRNVPLGPLYASSFRSVDHRKTPFEVGWKAVRIENWLQGTRRSGSHSIQRLELELDMLEEEEVLTVVMDSPTQAKELLLDKGSLIKKFARDVVVGGNGPVVRLQVIVPSVCENEQLTAKTAARLAVEVTAAANVRELVVSSSVFIELANISLHATVRSVGIVDDRTSSSFLHALPTSLERLANDAAASEVRRSVWMQRMRLRDDGEAVGTEVMLKRAEMACRRAETEGLSATGVRGVIEQWMRERKQTSV